MKARTTAILLLTVALAPAAWAQQVYPAKPIRLLVPFAPGGGVDLIARVIGPQITKSFTQQVVVDNRPGGGGTIAAETVVRADPDGYTLLMASGAYSANAALYQLPYDPLADVQPIVRIGETGFIIVVRPSLPVKTVKELIAHARANPGKLNYGSSGAGGIQHLATELFKLETKTQMTHVPYKGMGPALTANIGGEIDLTFGSIPSTQPHVRSGRLRALAVTSAKRSNALPDVPTTNETVPGFEVVNWFGVIGPKGMSKTTVARLNTEIAKALRSDEMKAQMATEGVEPDGGSPEQFLQAIRREMQDWKRVVKEAKITTAG